MNIISSFGRSNISTQFTPLFPPKNNEFKPLEIKRLYYEDQEIKTQESHHSHDDETQSGIAQEN